jgi:KTSC domain
MSEHTNTALTRFITMSPVPKRERVAASPLPPITRRPVISSMMQSAGYDDDHAVLEIEFVTGHVYRYHAVPRRILRELLDAESKGRYFDAYIRDKYPTMRVRSD